MLRLTMQRMQVPAMFPQQAGRPQTPLQEEIWSQDPYLKNLPLIVPSLVKASHV